MHVENEQYLDLNKVRHMLKNYPFFNIIHSHLHKFLFIHFGTIWKKVSV